MKCYIYKGLMAAVLAQALTMTAQTVFTTDFEAGLPAGFSGSGTVTGTEGYSAHGFDNFYLRNDSSGNPASATSLSLGGLGAHTHLEISFDLAIIDSWDGNTPAGGTVPPDFFNMTIDGGSVFSHTFDNFIAGDQTYLGAATVLPVMSIAQNTGWPDSAYLISITVPHASAFLDIDWFASGAGWQAGLDESWAIDNLTVTLRNRNNVPDAGSTLSFLIVSIIGLRMVRQRRS